MTAMCIFVHLLLNHIPKAVLGAV